MSDTIPDLDAIRALLAEHDTITAEAESAATAYLAASAALSARTFSDREHRQCVIDKDAAEARFLRSRADLRLLQRSHGADSINLVRHLLDVVDRQHAMLGEHQWAAADRDLESVCPECQHYKPDDTAPHITSTGHAPDCALDALLRETA